MLLTYDQVLDKINQSIGEEVRFQSTEGHNFNASDICFVTIGKNRLICYLKNGEKSKIKGDLKEVEKTLNKPGYTFIRTHRGYLVNIEQIRRVSKGKTKNEFNLFFENHKKSAYLTAVHYKKVVKALDKISTGVSTLKHITPDSSYARKVRKLGLISIGIEELESLDIEGYNQGNPQAIKEVEEFKKTYDMRFLTKEKGIISKS